MVQVKIFSMKQEYIKYLHKFGTERIKSYSQYLLTNFKFTYIESRFIECLPNYYKKDDGNFYVFTQILNARDLWYTLYLNCY